MSSSAWESASSRRWPRPGAGQRLREVDAGHLFAPATTRLALRRGAFLRGYIYDFIHLFVPALDRATVDAALAGAENRNP
jgi:hypothetical protein